MYLKKTNIFSILIKCKTLISFGQIIMNKRHIFHIFIFCGALSATFSSQALIVEFFQELDAISEFNARNRQALYNSVSSMFSSQEKEDSDVSRSFSEKDGVSENLDRPFTFDDIAGEVSQDIIEIVDFIKEPERFARVGAKMPKGIIMYGPPGTGKTSLARAIAGEAQAEFFTASGSDFVEIYVGVGPKRVRELFEKARACKKALIFIDEIDAIGGKRSGETNSEYRNTLNELLKQMDGFERSNITVIAATNRVEDLDEALLRPGRFDRIVEVALPNMQSRMDIFKHYCKKIASAVSDETIQELANKSTGFSGADIKNVINEAAVFAARARSDEVTNEHIRQAFEKTVKQKRNMRKAK